MKLTTFIIAAGLSLQVSILFADNNETSLTVNHEADFNDAIEDQVFDLNVLAPATPAVADFE